MEESAKVTVSAPKLVASIGCLVMIYEGILYLLLINWYGSWSNTDPMFLVAGLANLVAGIILFLVINPMGLNIDIKIPYVWWLLLAIGAGILFVDFLINGLVYSSILGTTYYWGGLLVGIAGLLEWNLIPEKLGLSHSKFVMLIGSAMVIIIALLSYSFLSVWMYVAIGLSVLLILAIFDVAIPYEWWLVLGIALAIFMLIHPASGVVLLVGYLLVQLDY